MDLTELLYWEFVSDLTGDDYGIWEIAWRANTLAGVANDSSRDAARQVIERLIAEGFVVAIDETGKEVSESELADVLAGSNWARAERPTPLIQLHAGDNIADRAQQMPREAIDALSTSWKAGLDMTPRDEG